MTEEEKQKLNELAKQKQKKSDFLKYISNWIFILLTFFFAYAAISSIYQNYPILAYALGILYAITGYSLLYNLGENIK